MTWLRNLWAWLGPQPTPSLGHCTWCHTELAACPTCHHSNWATCPDCSLGLHCPQHRRWWIA